MSVFRAVAEAIGSETYSYCDVGETLVSEGWCEKCQSHGRFTMAVTLVTMNGVHATGPLTICMGCRRS